MTVSLSSLAGAMLVVTVSQPAAGLVADVAYLAIAALITVACLGFLAAPE